MRSDNKYLLKLDIKNAYNSLPHQVIEANITGQLPQNIVQLVVSGLKRTYNAKSGLL